MRLIAILASILILAGGSGYYYFFTVEPRNYALSIFRLQDELKEQGKILYSADIKRRTDYEGALAILSARHRFLDEAQARISQLNIPRFVSEELHQLRRDLLDTLEGYKLATDDAEARAKFLAKFSDLGILVDPEIKPPFDEKTAHVRDLQAFFESSFGGLKQAMEGVVVQELPPLNGEVDFNELKLLWKDARSAVDLMLNFVRVQDPNAKLAGSSPIGSTRQHQEASERVNKFGETLKKLLGNNTAYDILAYRYFEHFDEKITKPSERADKLLNKLRAKYDKSFK